MAITLPPSLTDRLLAVNILLQSIGESPVNSVEISEAVDVAAASQAIDEIDLSVQSQGWHFNREEGITLTPNSSSEIVLPANCLSVAQAYPGPHSGKLGERARKLYDRGNHTYKFTAPVQLDLIVRLEWEELPEYARRYITIRAAQLFQGRIQSSRIVGEVQQPEVDEAKAVLEQREDEANPQNAISGNAQVLSRLHGRGVRRRS